MQNCACCAKCACGAKSASQTNTADGDPVTYTKALFLCSEIGGLLPSLHSMEQQKAITAIRKANAVKYLQGQEKEISAISSPEGV